MANVKPGTLFLTVSTMDPAHMVVMERLKTACDDYVASPFSLDRRSVARKKYGGEVLLIMRRFADAYPEFLVDKFFAFQWFDAARMPKAAPTAMGLVVTQNGKNEVDGAAAAEFMKTVFMAFKMADVCFVAPVHLVTINGGANHLPELYSVTKTKVVHKDLFGFYAQQKRLADVRDGS